MSKPINHHFVPKHFLRPWATDESTQVYVFEAQQNFTHSLSEICSRNYFHGNPKVEKELSNIERRHEDVLRKIRSTMDLSELSDSEIATLLSFVAFQRNRTRAVKQEVWESGEEIISEGLREDFEDSSLVLDEQESYIDGLTDAYIQSIHYFLIIHGIFGHIILGDLQVALLYNQTDTPFVTCDVPIAHDNPCFKSGESPSGPGVANSGIQLFCPISPSLSIFLYDPECYQVSTNQKGQILLDQPEVIRKINDLQVYDARDIIIHNGAPEVEIQRLHKTWEESDRIEEISQTHESGKGEELELNFEPSHQIPTFSPEIPNVWAAPTLDSPQRQQRDPARYKKQKELIHRVMQRTGAPDAAVIYAVRIQLESLQESD